MIETSEGGSRFFTAAAAVVIALVGITGMSVAPFAEPATPTDGVVQIAWWVTFALTIWFVGSVLLWRLALRSRRRGWRVLARRIALPGSRKLAESTLALSLMFGAGACSVGPENSAPVLSLVATGVQTEASVESTMAPTTMAPTTMAPTTVAPTTVAPTTTAEPLETTQRETTTSISPQESPADETPPQPESAEPSPARPEFESAYQVRAGDNLWTIAEEALRTAKDAEPTTAEVATYWRKLVAHVRDSIESGEPNLIYPGEVLNLPDPV